MLSAIAVLCTLLVLCGQVLPLHALTLRTRVRPEHTTGGSGTGGILQPFEVDDNFIELIVGRQDRSTTQTLTASTQINCNSAAMVPVVGSGGAVTLTVNPQIATPAYPKLCVIQGTSDSNTVTLQNGNGLVLSGGSVALGANDLLLTFFTGSIWVGYNLSPPSLDLSDFGAQAANTAIMGPTSGGTALPTWRALTDADVPNTIILDNITQITNRAITSLTGACADTSVWGGTASGQGAQCQADDDTPDSDAEVPDVHTLDIGAGAIIQFPTVSRCLRVDNTGKVVVASGDCPDGDTGGGGGGNDPTAFHDDIAGEINALLGKNPPVAGDVFVIEDSDATFEKKKVTLDALRAALLPIVLGTDTTGAYVADVTANQGLLKTGDTAGLIDCAAGQVLKRNGADTAWECAADDNTGGGGGSGAFSDAGDPVVLNSPTKDVVIGGTTIIDGAKVTLDGDADQIQLKLQAHSTQTANLIEAEQSNGTTQTFALTPAGDVRAQSMQDIDGPGSAWSIDSAGVATFSSLTVTPVDDPQITWDAATPGETKWSAGTNHDSAGDDDDPWELRTNATPGSAVRLSVPAVGCTTGQVLKSNGSGILTCGADDNSGGGGSGDVTAVGACTTGDCGIANGPDLFPLFYEGVADANEGQFVVTNPTADRTYTVPDASGEFTLLGQSIEGSEISTLAKTASALPVGDATPNISSTWAWRTSDATVITDFVDASGDHSDFTTMRYIHVTINHENAGITCAATGPISCPTNDGNWLGDVGYSYGCVYSPESSLWSCTVSHPPVPTTPGLDTVLAVDKSYSNANDEASAFQITRDGAATACSGEAGWKFWVSTANSPTQMACDASGNELAQDFNAPSGQSWDVRKAGSDCMSLNGSTGKLTFTNATTGCGGIAGNVSFDNNVAATGTIKGLTAMDAKTTATYTVTSSDCGSILTAGDTDAIEFDLPASIRGCTLRFVDEFAAGVITIDPNGTQVITFDGTAAAAGEAIVSSGAKGEALYCLGDGTGWYCYTAHGIWTEATP